MSQYGKIKGQNVVPPKDRCMIVIAGKLRMGQNNKAFKARGLIETTG
jgi:hypothetical protein